MKSRESFHTRGPVPGTDRRSVRRRDGQKLHDLAGDFGFHTDAKILKIWINEVDRQTAPRVSVGLKARRHQLDPVKQPKTITRPQTLAPPFQLTTYLHHTVALPSMVAVGLHDLHVLLEGHWRKGEKTGQ